MSKEIAAPRRYRFGPLPRRGVFGDMRGGQLAVIAIAVLAALTIARKAPGALSPIGAIVFLAIGGAAAFVNPRGRGADEWLPILRRFGLRRLRGGLRWRSPAPLAGHGATPDLVLPAELTDVEILPVPWRGGTVGICKSQLDGTYTAVMAVKTVGLGLVEVGEQERAGAQWGAALASLAAEASPVTRVSWAERSVPSDGDELGRYLAEERDETVPIDAPAMQSYLGLLEEPGTVGKEHELFLALQISRSSARVEIREEGGGDQGACAVLLRELAAWAETLGSAQLTIHGVLTPRMLARHIRTAYDPFARQTLARMDAARGAESDGGLDLDQASPLAADEGWDHYRTDGAVHTTYWISSWPTHDVGMQFLAPLLLSGDVTRTTAVVMEVLSPSDAERKVEHERTSDIALASRRQREGAMTTARQRRRYEATAAREDELSHGHALVRFTGFVTASSPELAEHRRSRLQIETLARRARLGLRIMYGEQAAAFSFTLPLCRGLR